jgi:hypothetical protein
MARLFSTVHGALGSSARPGQPMTAPSRNSVGVYDRPHPLRTRKVLIPAIVAVIVAIVYGLWAYLA